MTVMYGYPIMVLIAFYIMIMRGEKRMEVSKPRQLFRKTDRRTHGPAVSQPAALPDLQLTRCRLGR